MVGRYIALAVACCWIAAAPILIRVSEVDPESSLWLRMLIAATVLAAAPDRNQPASSRRRIWLLAASLAFAIDILAYHLAVVRTSVANTAVLGQISPLVVAPLGYLLFGERQSTVSMLGLFGTFAGAVLLAGTGGSASYLGDGLAALSGVSYGVYLLILKGLAGNVSPRRTVLWNCVVTALLVTPLALGQGAPTLPHTAHGWFMILAMAFGCQLLGHGLIVYAIERLPASLTSQALLMPPVLSAAAASMLFHEWPGSPQFAGAGLVLAGLCLAARHERRMVRTPVLLTTAP